MKEQSTPLISPSRLSGPPLIDSPERLPPTAYSQPVKSVAARKEQQRRLEFTRLIDQLSAQDLVGKEYAIRYLHHKFRRNCRRNTLINMSATVRFFLAWLQINGNVLEDIRREEIEAFVEHEQDRGLSVRCIHCRLKILYSFAGYLVERQVVTPDILTKKIKIKLPESLPRAVDPEDLKAMFCCMKDIRDRALFLLLLRTGMRIGELLDLRMADVCLPERKILIYEGEKNARGRVVYYSDDAEQALRAWLDLRNPQEEMLFYGYGGAALSYGAAYMRFRKYLEAAGLADRGYSIHCLRHTYASELLNAGLRLEVLQQLLGHSSLEVTRQYARLTDKTREAEYFRAMALIERGGIDGLY